MRRGLAALQPGRRFRRHQLRALTGAAVTAAALTLVACGSAETAETGERMPRPQEDTSKGTVRGLADNEPSAAVEPSHCPLGHPACRETVGRIVYVERVDPDGDGDAHFVIHDPQSITLPDLTAIDIEKSLRPHPLPGPGDLISAAGPVQTGSYGQHQIHALELQIGS